MTTGMLKAVFNTNSKKKNNDLVNVIKIELINLIDEIYEMS